MLKIRGILNIAAAIVAVEALAMYVAAASYAFGIVSNESRSLPAMISLLAICLLVAVWLTFAAKSLRHNQRWSRSSALFWQTCQLAIAAESFTGAGANFFYGISLIVPSVIVFGLLFSKPVLQDAKRQEL